MAANQKSSFGGRPAIILAPPCHQSCRMVQENRKHSRKNLHTLKLRVYGKCTYENRAKTPHLFSF
jgi:hypothetical protein